METRDTILRLIEQTALILRAFFNTLPLEDKGELALADFSSTLKTKLGIDLDFLLTLTCPEEIQTYFESHPSFDATNQELVADLLVAKAAQLERTNPQIAKAYQRLALCLYQGINQRTQIYNWEREAKITRLKQ
ncbi:hypothetical protein H4K35_00495 [Myroides sp. NP-2]|uniref:hypothetical protein n=1 Tax=Myroides sp. NP-2 TaxID=2759945 RepID=UPI0015FC41AF|nr:hypothetical protein [Myroides sp. NP-2]MBB1148623.1 hypothetical protein [Myroides sp. NP-2]